MKIKTSELEGAALDWAVAYALNGSAAFFDAFGARMLGRSITAEVLAGEIKPSTDWCQAGPLIGEYCTAMQKSVHGYWAHCCDRLGEGQTILIAACRAIVAANLGDTVDVPEELV